MSFSNKVILITGASSGIGAHAAKYFAKEGALLSLVGRNAGNLTAVVTEIKQSGVKQEPLAIVADVTTDTQRIIDETINRYKRLDVLINNAGFAIPGSIETATVEAYDSVMNTNLRAVFVLTQLATPHLIAAKGNIINISSIAGIRSFPHFLAYCISKAALDQFTKCVALELAPKGVRVNSVNPGAVPTNFAQNAGITLDHDEMGKSYPLGRVGATSDVTAAIAYLAGDSASFITGVLLPVDGGKSIECPR